ncbi:RNA methyltransferase [Chlamydiia bacterium]|nr:RNA methyltransferase [Chlamydiia bacterium]
MKDIQSISNSSVKHVTRLRQSKYRKQYKQFLVDDWQCIKYFDSWANNQLNNYQPVIIYFCRQHLSDKLSKWLTTPKKYCHEIINVNDAVIQKMSCRENTSGIVICCPQPEKKCDLPATPCVILDGVEKPGNIGAVMRTCVAMGVKGLILHNCSTDLWNHNICRASAGSCFMIAAYTMTTRELKQWVSKQNVELISADANDDNSVVDLTMTTDMAFVFGSENKGVSQEMIELSSKSAIIPMCPGVDSLNVSTALAMIVYEMSRQGILK